MGYRTKSMKTHLYSNHIGTIRTIEYGAGDTLIILLHGAGGSPASLSEMASYLGNVGYHVVAPALSGYMDSSTHVAGDIFEQHKAIVNWLVNEFPAKSIVLGGHSLGSLIVLSEMLNIQPAAVILIEPIIISLLDEQNPQHQKALHHYQSLRTGIHQAITDNNPQRAMQIFVDFWSDFSWHQLPEIFTRQLIKLSSQIIDELKHVHATEPDREALGTFTAPVLLLDGDRSAPIAGCVLDSLQSLIKNSHRATIADAGHMGPMFQPLAYSKQIEAFLKNNLH